MGLFSGVGKWINNAAKNVAHGVGKIINQGGKIAGKYRGFISHGIGKVLHDGATLIPGVDKVVGAVDSAANMASRADDFVEDFKKKTRKDQFDTVKDLAGKGVERARQTRIGGKLIDTFDKKTSPEQKDYLKNVANSLGYGYGFSF